MANFKFAGNFELNISNLRKNIDQIIYIIYFGYNNMECNNNLIQEIWCYGINYFLRQITITFLF